MILYLVLYNVKNDQLSAQKSSNHNHNHKISVKRGCSLDKLAVHLIDVRKLDGYFSRVLCRNRKIKLSRKLFSDQSDSMTSISRWVILARYNNRGFYIRLYIRLYTLDWD